jgi:hypothetical protein
MVQSDLTLLLDMGFEKERAELAVKKTGGCMFLFPYPNFNQLDRTHKQASNKNL